MKAQIQVASGSFRLDDSEPNCCEVHNDRFLEANPLVQNGLVREEGQDLWDIYVTKDGWTIGDEKCMIALCPECSAQRYDIA